MMANENLYIVAYDIADQKRWRRVFRTLKGYGEWLQFSVFQCRLNDRRRVDLVAELDGIIHHQDDHVLLLDFGPADSVEPKIISMGKTFEALTRQPIII